jgi:hypothetical protein
MFEKKVRVLYVKPFSFTNTDTGEVIQGCKIHYCYSDLINEKDEKGYKCDFANLSYDLSEKLLKSDLPLETIGKFKVNGSNVLKLYDIVLK